MTRKMTLTLVSVLSLAVAAGAVQAQDAAPKPADAPHAGFAAMDFNGDGKITLEDFTAKRLAEQKAMDPDGDGFLTLEEMKTYAGDKARKRAEDRAERRFKALDTDGDGRISAAEALMGQDGRGHRGGRGFGPGPEQFIAMADKDKDGAVSPEEFEAARKAMREHHGKRAEGRPGHGRHGEGKRGDGRGPKPPMHGHAPGQGPQGGPAPDAPAPDAPKP